jgi:NAD(P)-dependent dehydrogenase (short-subunit alcohol dehydrogenase family)
MELDLKDKVIIVTGASKGIGLAIIKVLVREGARIVAGSRTTTSELTGLHDRHDLTVITVDLATANGPTSLIDAAAKRHGKIDVLINNVGIASARSGFLDISDDEWQRVFNLTFFSAVRATRAALPYLVASRGAIVNVGSINGRLPFPMVVDYSAAKAALSNLSKALSEEFAPRGVRVNVVAPGPVRTPFWTDPGGFADVVASGSGVSAKTALDETVPRNMGISTGRVTEADEVADLVAYLASSRAANITGAEFVIDGGQIKTT